MKLSSKKRVLGLPIDDVTLPALIGHLDERISEKRYSVIYGFSVTLLGRLGSIPELFDYFEDFDFVISDGAGIPPLARVLGIKLNRYIGIPNLADELVKLCSDKGYKLMLFGATAEINKEACENLKRRFPDLKLCSGIHGYFKEGDEPAIAEKIKQAAPDVLFIGISSPIKERFSLTWKDYMEVPVILPCGGMIDIYAGKTKREPRFLFRLPLAWLFRYVQEPLRLFRPLLLPGLYFVFVVFPKAMVRIHFLGKKNVTLKELLLSDH
jgi:N-acetylglucosaminyldiphosphoundecaprenol N-acetyl-beta-D-mannosaminyltransferase